METNQTKPKFPKGKELKNYAAMYLSCWQEELYGYPQQEITLRKLFKMFPTNQDFDEIMIKVATLDSFYSTRLKSVFNMAKQIYFMRDFDKMLQDGKRELVDKMCKMSGYTPFSFSSKYCSHHFPDIYPIYDSLVANLLIYYQTEEEFYGKGEKLTISRLRASYADSFYPTMAKFREVYDLKEYSFKELDRILWTMAKMEYGLNEDEKLENLKVTYDTAKIDDNFIKIGKKGVVSVYELRKDVKAALEEFFSAEGYNVAQDDNIIELVKKILIGKWEDEEETTATIGKYHIELGEEGNVNVYKIKDNTLDSLRKIGNRIMGNDYNDDWTTHQAGRKIVNYVHEHPESSSK